MPGGQPLSQYSTDYKQARGNGGFTEPDVRFTQGQGRPLTIALSASQRGQSIVAPRFVWITTERHRKEGERGATRSPFLVVRIEPRGVDMIDYPKCSGTAPNTTSIPRKQPKTLKNL